MFPEYIVSYNLLTYEVCIESSFVPLFTHSALILFTSHFGPCTRVESNLGERKFLTVSLHGFIPLRLLWRLHPNWYPCDKIDLYEDFTTPWRLSLLVGVFIVTMRAFGRLCENQSNLKNISHIRGKLVVSQLVSISLYMI